MRLTLDTLDTCGRFKQMLDDGKDTDEYIEALENNVQQIAATGKIPTLEEILIALMISSMQSSGSYWETLA